MSTAANQDRTNPNHKVSGPLGIRTSVWFIICGVLLTCVLLISISRRHASPSAVQAASADEDATRHELSHTRSGVRPIYRVPPPDTGSEADAQPTSPRASAAVSN